MADRQMSEELREQGNALYRANDIEKAIVAYHEAVAFDPTDTRPVSNLSAAYFQIGKYADSVEYSRQALDLMSSQDSIPEKMATIEARIVKSKQHIPLSEKTDIEAHRISTIPRYRPCVFENLDYRFDRNDIPHSISDPELFETRAKEGLAKGSHDYLFVGIGDARNLSEPSRISRKSRARTIDNKTAVIARNVLIAILVEELTTHERSVGRACVNTLNTLFFLYATRMVPQQTLSHIQELISIALTRLKSGTDPALWLRLRPRDIPALIDCLLGWQTKAASVITPKKRVERIQVALVDELPAYNTWGLSDLDAATEERMYFNSCFVYPAEHILRLQPKALRGLVRDRSDFDMPERCRKIRELVAKHWAVNPVMIDLEILTKGICTPECVSDHMGICGNPLRVSQDLPEVEDLLEESFDFFGPLREPSYNSEADSSSTLRLETTQMCLSMTFVFLNTSFEAKQIDLRIGQLPLTEWISPSSQTSAAVTSLSSSSLRSPMLKQHAASWMSLHAVRNAFVWSGNTHLLAEYVLTDRPASLKELFNVRLIQKGDNVNLPVVGRARYGNHVEALSYEALLPRRGLTRWLHAHFFKITVPAQPQADKHHMVFAPLNLTNFFRLIARVRGLGYPAHWLSAILEEILSGSILSEARLPKTSPVEANAMQSQFDAMDMSTLPFVPEIRTLYPIFQPMLQFHLPDAGLPVAGNLVRCSFSLPPFNGGQKSNNLSLIFWPKRYHWREDEFPDALGRPAYLRDMLVLPKKELPPLLATFASLHDPSRVFRENGSCTEEFAQELSIWTTFEWKAHSKTGVVVMEERYHKKLLDEDWYCGLWGSDHLEPAVGVTMPVKEAFTGTEKWVDFADAGKGEKQDLATKMAGISIA